MEGLVTINRTVRTKMDFSDVMKQISTGTFEIDGKILPIESFSCTAPANFTINVITWEEAKNP